MEFELNAKREFFEEQLFRIGKEYFDNSEKEYRQIIKEIPLLIFILLFSFLIYETKIIFMFYILMIVFIIISIIKKTINYYKSKKSYNTFSWNYSEEYYKELLTYKSIKLSTQDDNLLLMNTDGKITTYNLNDTKYYRIEEELLYITLNNYESLFIPKKTISTGSYEELKIFVKNKVEKLKI